MDLKQLKEKLGDEKFSELETYVNDLIGQRDAARDESIKGRKGLKAKVTELETLRDDLFERLGIESVDDLKDLDPKGQAEAVKQFEAKMKRLERELGDKSKALDELSGKYRGTLQDAALRKAMGSHEFIDSDLVASFVAGNLEWEDDKVLYRTAQGGLVPLDEGLNALVKEKPHLLKAAGAGGSGYRGGSGNGSGQENPWAEKTRNITRQIEIARDDPKLAEQLKAAAQAA